MARDSRSMPPGLATTILGIAVLTLGRPLDGWLGGLLAGAGVAMVLIGVVRMGAGIGRARSAGRGWLPSRDGDG